MKINKLETKNNMFSRMYSHLKISKNNKKSRNLYCIGLIMIMDFCNIIKSLHILVVT